MDAMNAPGCKVTDPPNAELQLLALPRSPPLHLGSCLKGESSHCATLRLMRLGRDWCVRASGQIRMRREDFDARFAHPGAQISSLGGGTSEPGNPWATLEKKRAVLTTAAHFYWSNRLDMKWP